MNRILLLMTLLAAAASFADAAAGDLDPTFGQNGLALTDVSKPGLNYFDPEPQSILVQPDGKILVSGTFWEDGISYWFGTLIVRYLPDGSLDATFGDNGKVIVLEGYGSQGVGNDMALTPDGKILLIGTDFINGGILVRRFTSSGGFDTSFGSNGSQYVYGQAAVSGSTVVVQPDGKIVGVGWDNDWMTGAYQAFIVFRLSSEGSPDPTFGGGTGQISIANGFDSADVLIQPNGKILISGFLTTSERAFIARFNQDGSPDTNFGSGGRIVSGPDKGFYNFALQSDGKIVVLGRGSVGFNTIERFNSDGSPDHGFGTDGMFIFDEDLLSVDSFSNTVMLQNDGKILATGNVGTASVYSQDLGIIRVTPTGSLDLDFGVDGRSVVPVNIPFPVTSAAAMQRDDNILVSGYSADGNLNFPNPEHQIALIRLDGGVRKPPFDFDGDGKADTSVYRPGEGNWYVNGSEAGFMGAVNWGIATDKLVAADYDGDGRTDHAVYRDGVWWVLGSNGGGGYTSTEWGIAIDVPVPADYDGDGRADLAVYRNGIWWILYANGSGYTQTEWGISTDKPVPADYDGDGKADLAVYRNGDWWVMNSNGGGYTQTNWGISTDKPVPADYDGDGKTDLAVYRDGDWWVVNSNGGYTQTNWGISTDKPVPADYDGDGKTDLAIYRNGDWWILNSGPGGGYTQTNWGLATDIPIPHRSEP